jgi:predicted ATPase
MVLANCFAALTAQFRRDPDAVLRHVDAAEATAAEQRLALVFDPRMLRGGAMVGPELAHQATAQIQEGLASRTAATRLVRSYGQGLLCNALRLTGELDAADAVVAEAIEAVEASGERWWEAELRRLQGLLLMERDRLPEAEATLRLAITVARRQEAKSLELRAATSLGGLWSENRRRAEAHDLLTPIYSWFTEGFSTPDLTEAKALLDSL